MVSSINTVGVVGAGIMGHGIAQVSAMAGYRVKLSDLSDDILKRALKRIEGSLKKFSDKGKISPEEEKAALARIETEADLSKMAEADFVIEAATENLQTKLDLFSRLDGISGQEVILASNTSSLPITKLAAATKRPEKVIGLHFMNPVPLMQLVEVVRGPLTSEETLSTSLALVEKLGKTSVVVKDFPGFVSNRILMPLLNEAMYVLWEGTGEAEGIDTVARLGLNHPMGPLALADLIGLDTCLSVMEVLYEGFLDPKYRPCPLLRQMVDAGLLGRKSGKGFYDYTGG
ncbi:MAG: 3-hydroxyacyl-CoA dehydrogenase family protein [Nitrospinota bacterium]